MGDTATWCKDFFLSNARPPFTWEIHTATPGSDVAHNQTSVQSTTSSHVIWSSKALFSLFNGPLGINIFLVKTSLWNQEGLWGKPWGAGRQTTILSALQSANSLLQTMGSLTWQGQQSIFPVKRTKGFSFSPTTTMQNSGQGWTESQSGSRMIHACACAQSLSRVWPHGLNAARLLCPRNSPGKNTGVGCHCLLQGIIPTQELNPGLLYCRQILYHLSHQGSPEGSVRHSN